MKIDTNFEDFYIKKNLTKNSKKVFEIARKMSFTRFNKSYCFVKFKDYTSKQNFLNKYVKLFGIYINDKCYRAENAELKRTLVIKNIPYNASVGEVCSTIN